MEKTIVTKYGGINSKVGELLVNRLVANRYMDAVGPFVFLDHLYPAVHKPKLPSAPKGSLNIRIAVLQRSVMYSTLGRSKSTL